MKIHFSKMVVFQIEHFLYISPLLQYIVLDGPLVTCTLIEVTGNVVKLGFIFVFRFKSVTCIFKLVNKSHLECWLVFLSCLSVTLDERMLTWNNCRQ